MSYAKRNDTCIAIGAVIAAIIAGIIAYFIAQSTPLWLAIVAFLLLLAVGLLLAQKLCSKNVPAPMASAETVEAVIPETTPEPVIEEIEVAPVGEVEQGRPETLTAARDGKGDDLKKIKGVGPKMQAMLNGMGFYHFDQIASWTDAEVAWVDDNLEGFKGRVTRDTWVEQSKLLAAGGETEFSKKVDKGGVY